MGTLILEIYMHFLPAYQRPNEEGIRRPLMQSHSSASPRRDRARRHSRPVELEGIAIKDRLVLVYSKNDAVTQLKQVSDPFGNGYDAETCKRLGVNIVAYALQN